MRKAKIISHQTEELKKFRWLFFLLVPLFAISINFILFGERYFSNLKVFVFSTLLLLAVTLVLSSAHITVANLFREWIYQEDKLIKRLLVSSCIYFPLTALFVTGIFFGYDSISFMQYTFSVTQYKWGLLAGAVCDVIGIAMNEGIYGYSKWKETKLEAEQLSKEKLQTQLNGLLQQINPHFLFNSLNSLSALIQEDPKQAQKFLSDMSKVYRYLLRTNETELTTVTTELQFIDSYFHMLPTRFGAGVQLIKSVDSKTNNYLLPPLTLQLLLENGVKHNTVAKSKPLYIEIIASDYEVLVRNNLQKKTIKVASGKVGLSNIAEKYRLINKSSIAIKEADGYFTVTVPLIKPADAS